MRTQVPHVVPTEPEEEVEGGMWLLAGRDESPNSLFGLHWQHPAGAVRGPRDGLVRVEV